MVNPKLAPKESSFNPKPQKSPERPRLPPSVDPRRGHPLAFRPALDEQRRLAALVRQDREAAGREAPELCHGVRAFRDIRFEVLSLGEIVRFTVLGGGGGLLQSYQGLGALGLGERAAGCGKDAQRLGALPVFGVLFVEAPRFRAVKGAGSTSKRLWTPEPSLRVGKGWIA